MCAKYINKTTESDSVWEFILYLCKIIKTKTLWQKKQKI